MVITIEELVRKLRSEAGNDAGPSDALWIRFGKEKTTKTVEYRTADGNQLAHVYMDGNSHLVGIEIFP